MALLKRLINLTFVLGEGQFGADGSNTVELSGLRVHAEVIKAGGPSMGTLQMQVYGMTLSKMNQLSTLGMIATTKRKNSITVTAGDERNGMGTVFQGTITNAYSDFQGAPDVPFFVNAHTGLIEALAPAKPSSFKGAADVATILSGLATQIGVSFENNGVSVKLSNPYYAGSPRVQAQAVVADAGIEWNGIDNGVLAIWNPGQSRRGTAPLISPSTGLVGYPSFTSNGIMLRTLFNPSIGFGQQIIVESSLKGPLQKAASAALVEAKPGNFERQISAGGTTWVVYGLEHALDSQIPGGQWFSTVQAAPIGFGPFVPSR